MNDRPLISSNKMFVYGSQLGWFALDGNDGILPYLANETNFRVVDYVSNLQRFRALGAEYLLYGQLMRPLDTTPADMSSVDSNCYAKVASAVWRSKNGNLGTRLIILWNNSCKNEFIYKKKKMSWKGNIFLHSLANLFTSLYLIKIYYFQLPQEYLQWMAELQSKSWTGLWMRCEISAWITQRLMCWLKFTLMEQLHCYISFTRHDWVIPLNFSHFRSTFTKSLTIQQNK